MGQDDKRNLLFTVIITTAILLGWQFLFPTKVPETPIEKPQQTSDQKPAPEGMPDIGAPSSSIVPTAPGGVVAPTAAEAPLDRSKVLSSGEGARLKIETPKLKGSILLKGARLDDLTLAAYRETPDEESSLIHLLSPLGSEHPYYAEFSWVSDRRGVALPNQETVWQAPAGAVLTPKTPVTLTWNNGQGLVFERTIRVDEDYLFTVTQRVTNRGGAAVRLYPYGLVSRHGTPETVDFFILHEGPLGYLNDKLVEHKYEDLRENPLDSGTSKGGWLGITDKYWLTALVPDQSQEVRTNFRSQAVGTRDHYQVDFMGAAQDILPGASYEITSHFFAGAKILNLLDHYEGVLGVKNFDLAVDFGWFYIITKPLFLFLTTLYHWLGNFGIAIMILTLILKLFFFPLANKSYRSMARMKKLQPKIEKIRERFVDDKMRMNQEIMELYKKEKANPMAGCLPMLIQIPVFFALYKVLFVTIEMRHAPFFGWIHDLSSPDPTTLFNLFGLIPWDPPGFLMLGVWPLIMGGTMFLQQKISPPPADPMQARVFMLMPIMFTFMLAQFPAGLVIYWAWNNILTIIQQWSIMRLEKAKEERG